MTALAWGIALAVGVVFWVLYPVVAGRRAPMERDEEELTEAQHRKRIALYALRDVEYDFHAGKLDERDYKRMKTEIAAEALDALDQEAAEWAAREGRRAAREKAHAAAAADAVAGAHEGSAVHAGSESHAAAEGGGAEPRAGAAPHPGGAAPDEIEAEIAALRATLRDGAVCRECAHPNPPGSRFCGECGSALRAQAGSP